MQPGSFPEWPGTPDIFTSCAGSPNARKGERDAASPKPEPDRRLDRRLEDDMMALVEQDLANVEAGIYPVPADHDGSSAGRTSISSSPTRRRSRRKTTVATP
jgi:hypothetical protein